MPKEFDGPSSIGVTFNGFWSKLTLGVMTTVLAAVIIGGLGGIVVTMRATDAGVVRQKAIDDHETRLRAVESQMVEIKSGISILLERTRPPSNNH